MDIDREIVADIFQEFCEDYPELVENPEEIMEDRNLQVEICKYFIRMIDYGTV